MHPADDREITLLPLAEADIEPLIALGRTIWLAHYVPLIGADQVDYMMRQRFTPDNLRRYLPAHGPWLDVLRSAGELIGYTSCALSGPAREMKLEQLYLAHARHGCGFGYRMLKHVEQRALALGCRGLVLQVNKQNGGSLAFYGKAGFTVREEAVFDIGQGYVMDDYVMEKRLT